MNIQNLSAAKTQSSSSTSLSGGSHNDFAQFLQSENASNIPSNSSNSHFESLTVRELKNLIASMYLDRWFNAESDEERQQISELFESIMQKLEGVSGSISVEEGTKITEAFTSALDDLKKSA